MLVGEEMYGEAEEHKNIAVLVKQNVARAEIETMLRPKIDAERIVEYLQGGDWQGLLKECQGSADPEVLEKTLRLHETLFCEHKRISKHTSESRVLRLELINSVALMILELLSIDPLKGDQKKLTKYL